MLCPQIDLSSTEFLSPVIVWPTESTQPEGSCVDFSKASQHLHQQIIQARRTMSMSAALRRTLIPWITHEAIFPFWLDLSSEDVLFLIEQWPETSLSQFWVKQVMIPWIFHQDGGWEKRVKCLPSILKIARDQGVDATPEELQAIVNEIDSVRSRNVSSEEKALELNESISDIVDILRSMLL